ncbi:C-terminal-binding protein 1 [Merluccius polli]|uniref:THAP domain-containing protein 1 n=1 Tax=Merluccius polli TaxID=89951 RepID=A0AA47P6B8_MERPO|nr:C-terminal-binding protein 1 [Merluccius polli]KAK0148237.1 C-terminal-binding protein 1 [Merluccius polli]
MVRTCDFPGCNNKDLAESLHTFHRLPVTDIALRQLWLLAIGLNVETKLAKIKKLCVCSAHFCEDDYVPSCPGQRKKRVLKSAAVPAPQPSAPPTRNCGKITRAAGRSWGCHNHYK